MTAQIPGAFDRRSRAGAWTPAEEGRALAGDGAARSTASRAIGYFIAASVSLLSSRIDGNIAYCWLATALLMPRLAKLPFSHWPAPVAACVVASAIASSLFGAGPVMAVPVAVVVVGEAMIGALLLQRFAAGGHYFDDMRQLTRYTLIVGAVMPIVPAFGGAAVGSTAFGMP